MPIVLGLGPRFANMFAPGNMMGLMGHLIYGLILGEAYVAIVRKDAIAASAKA